MNGKITASKVDLEFLEKKNLNPFPHTKCRKTRAKYLVFSCEKKNYSLHWNFDLKIHSWKEDQKKILQNFSLEIVIFYTEIMMRKVVLS